MKTLEKEKILLLIIAPLLCISMMILIPFQTNAIGKTAGYISGFCIYWFVFCIPASIYISEGFRGVREIYSQKASILPLKRRVYYILAFTPCLAIVFVVFKDIAPKAGFQVLAIALFFALINGIIEEMFWRGAFNKVFNGNILFAFIYPSVFFGIWHIALFLAKGIMYNGGFASLVGGSLFMGLLWGWIAYKTKSIKVVTIAHITTNFLAFTGLIFENWF